MGFEGRQFAIGGRGGLHYYCGNIEVSCLSVSADMSERKA